MTTPRISAYLWTCHRCRTKRIWPFERHPSPATVKRARAEADRRLRCERCGERGVLGCFWENDWGGEDQLAARVEQAPACSKGRSRNLQGCHSTLATVSTRP